MIQVVSRFLPFLPVIATLCPAMAGQLTFDRYHTPAEIVQYLKVVHADHVHNTRLHTLATTPGQHPVMLLELGTEIEKQEKNDPSVLVVANMSGSVPLASEAALWLIQALLTDDRVRGNKTWYILPVGSPDAASRFFERPLWRDSRNLRPTDDDQDGTSDEDSPDDLNGDGWITMMRVPDPMGEWIPVPGNERLLKRADTQKGERGKYKLYVEGIDNDGDGRYNEDPLGGVNLSINFPHLFRPHTPTGGPWSLSEAETYNLVKFLCARREIGLCLVFGEANFCLNPPRDNRPTSYDPDHLKITERIGRQLGIDASKTYTMAEIMERSSKAAPPGSEMTESLMASMLGLGAAVNPQPADMETYREWSTQYRQFLREKKLDEKRLSPAADQDGSVELWAYYHLGIFSFALDFWTLPDDGVSASETLTPEKLETMSIEECLALGEAKIATLLREVEAPPSTRPSAVIEGLKNGTLTGRKLAGIMRQAGHPPKENYDVREKAWLAFCDKKLDGKGFVPWKPFKHPTLGDVEIGGLIPYGDTTPPATMIEGLLSAQVPWVFRLSDAMADVHISGVEVKPLESGMYRLEVTVENRGRFSYPCAMGKRNARVLPVILTLEGEATILQGRKRMIVPEVEALKTVKVTWLVKSEKAAKVKIGLITDSAGRDQRELTLGGAQ